MKQDRNNTGNPSRAASATALGIGLLMAGPVLGGEPVVVPDAGSAPPPEPAKSGFESFADKLWALPVLYKNEDNPFLQKLALIGRYHGQWHYGDANTGDDSDWENRRWRFGVEAELLEKLTFELQFNLDTTTDWSGDRFFENIEDFYLEWEQSDALKFTLGKQKVLVTQEWETSSKRILTFERSLIVNQIVPDKIYGFTVSGDVDGFLYGAGAFLGGLDGDWDWIESGSGYLLWASVGYDYSEAIGAKKAVVKLDYSYNDGDEENTGAEDYENILSLNTTHQWDHFGLVTDLIYANGLDDTDDVFGFVFMPYYDITSKLRLVGRYQYATSDGDAGIRLQSRYERRMVENGSSTRGDNYHAVYGGLNYYLYGDKLKLMTGVEWSTLGGNADYDGWTYLAGVRVYF